MSAGVTETVAVKEARTDWHETCGGPSTAVLTEIETAHVHEWITDAVNEIRMGCTHWSFYVLAGLATCLDCGHQWHV
ncbi:hypothetical protein AVL48_26540 [Amycolatopsis regifaucium]|uniref:Uncharacterized protein n=1 Tax=Amycolatopsis regifaucium TaxID=546365 RepID=A0A154MPW4_9PSEU|nr:hypothetical protein AVL48_26540 [Amycolatopsis regifaucium]SFJ26707.1 hypothetical protein SAMN04489731_1182 [Amycolatopsis regifaucium]